MPGSLLVTSSPRGVTRHESTRSDSSAASNTSQSSAAGNKKVSFNKAVRVKKYPRPSKKDAHQQHNGEEANGDSTKRFWFKVYKNKHRQHPDPNEFRKVIYYGNDDDGDVISYHPNPSVLNYPPTLTSECSTQTPNSRTALLGNVYTPLHPSQMPTDPPHVRRNYVKKIVNRFNEEAVLQRQRSTESEPYHHSSPPVSPPGSPRHHSTPLKRGVSAAPFPPPPPPPFGRSHQASRDSHLPPPPEGLFGSRFKRNPIVNGVKVIFGMGQLKKGDQHKNGHSTKHKDVSPRHVSSDREDVRNGDYHPPRKGPYKTEIIISDGSETEVKSPYLSYGKSRYDDRRYNNNNELIRANDTTLDYHRSGDQDDDYRYYFDGDDGDNRRKGKYHVEAWDSGNQLVFDTTDVNTASAKTDKGEFISTVGEKHQLWKNNKRVVVYEQPSPTIIRRKAKSHSDLSHPEEKYYEEDKIDKGVSTEELFSRKIDKKESMSKKQKDSWLKHLRSSTKDKGIQCNKLPMDEPEELYGFGRYKIIRPRNNGVVTAFSNVPLLNETKYNDNTISNHTNGYTSKDSAIYSQVDKSKKKKNTSKKKNFFSEEGRLGSLFKSRSEPLYIGPPPKSHPQSEDELDNSYYETKGERKVKTSRRSFGFNLNTGKDVDNGGNGKNFYREEDWYNLDGDVEAVERQKRRGVNHRDIAEVRQEMVEEAISDASSLSNSEQKRNGTAGSVIREVDFKKREISYENVPHPDGESNSQPSVGSGLWYRDADEDYRREMAQNEVTYPAGNSVGSERFYTVDRKDKPKKKNPPPSPRAYTLDRRHMKEQQKPLTNVSGVKILVNGKEINDKSSLPSKKFRSRIREDPSSVQSDPLCVRGGLAAAYQARQRNAVRRSNSSASGLHRTGSPRIRSSRGNHVSSEISAVSSGSDSTKRLRRPLVMYIPGISHQEKSSENDDRSSGVNIARSQSMMTASRPSKIVVKQRSSHHRSGHKGSRNDLYRNGDLYEEDEIMPLASDVNRKKPPKVPTDRRKQNDIKRSHSMPKDTKFSWLKWRIRGKPSREP